ncbi:hypothetical protein M433DRAFT_71445 [Acidomyces richmondensis BFW]|nr:MAG: hypothetical protein FE78DRAFT_484159 [Acidomyces sp. 'richmondensis']KYG43545.1 hypothetical protein M433DRAFT_71445 [Acidomyces richmondensis BFW]
MATKLAAANSPHVAGIFADMTVDGPEIGTLVVVVDRARNLPNRKSMGKQNPYCAARLGKEAKKTDTDKRGGQTPRWDQELRFTVHDSPDYQNLKISVFSEDKKTDLIGEAWASLTNVLVPGGGKSDMWQSLNCKGKYAGEIRIELTYYDTRPKPEKSEEGVEVRRSVGGTGRVKRRPLPSNPNSGHITPDTIPEPALPGRAKHGPRDFKTPPRAPSLPSDTMGFHHSQMHSLYGHQPLPHMQTQPDNAHHMPQQNSQKQPLIDYAVPHSAPLQYDEPYQQPDFLPQLPPSERQRAAAQQKLGHSRFTQSTMLQPRPHSHIGVPHSHSAPLVPTQHDEMQIYDDNFQLNTDYPEPIPDVDYQHRQIRQRRHDIPPAWQEEYEDPYARFSASGEDYAETPPPPPAHSNSAPAIPHSTSSLTARFGNTPPSARHQSIPDVSSVQELERGHNQSHYIPRVHPQRGGSFDNYVSSPERSPYVQTLPGPSSGQVSPHSRISPVATALPQRHSLADIYGNTPPRPHPLSQEIPQARIPNPNDPQRDEQYDYRIRDAPPLIKPRAVSPQPAPRLPPNSRPRSSYSIQHPVRAHESSDRSLLSSSLGDPRPTYMTNNTPITRKSISPRPSPSADSPTPNMPFSPDSFDVHNPHPRPSSLATSPHTPYQVQPDSEIREHQKGPIVNWHGEEVDPSDHLPVDSWAPEPEKKTPTKTYGLGRDRGFGPRPAQSGSVPITSGRISKDTVVNVRMKTSSTSQAEASSSSSRNRLVKKNGGPSRSSVVEPLQEHRNFNSVPNPYAQPEDFSHYGGFRYGSSPGGGPPPDVPPKLPFVESQEDALAREISSIDIGSGRNGRQSPGRNIMAATPTAYVPVRKHWDGRSFG